MSKLSEARDLVSQLQTDAATQEKLLGEKQLEAKMALQKITDTIQNAGVQRNEMQSLRRSIAEENAALTERFISQVISFNDVFQSIHILPFKSKFPLYFEAIKFEILTHLYEFFGVFNIHYGISSGSLILFFSF